MKHDTAPISDEKIVESLVWFAKKEGGTINYMKALKLIFLADKLHLIQFGNTILDDEYVAMRKGPVASRAYNAIKGDSFMGRQHLVEHAQSAFSRGDVDITAKRNGNIDYFSATELGVMDCVYDRFGDLNEMELVDFVHYLPEWSKHKNELNPYGDKKSVPMPLEDFFDDSADFAGSLFQINPAQKTVAKEDFTEAQNLRRALQGA